MPLLSFENISIGYDNHPIVENLSFDIEKGDYLTILGENGAGKSTLLKTMLGLIKPLSGKIVFDKKVKRTDIGYLPQQTVVQRDFPASVWEIVISGCLGKSGFLARALCSSDKILVLDEPVTGLDPKVTIQLYDIIDSLNKEGITIIMISHDLHALKHANRVLHLGHEIFFGKKEDYLKSQSYQAFMDKGGEQ